MNETDADKPENDGAADEPARPQSSPESSADSSPNPAPDPAQVTDADTGKSGGRSWKDKSTWLRGVFMVFFAIAFEIGKILLMCTALVQFLWLLFSRTPNELLQKFGRSLSAWLSQIAAYLTCVTNEKPFPWSPWPNGDPT